MLTLWKSLVIPIFDYCSQIYNPTKACQIQQLEMVQRSYIRKINGMKDKKYWDQLKILNLWSLQRRRERYQIIYIWKILEELVPNLTGESEMLQTKSDSRRRDCFVRAINRSGIQKIKHNSLAIRGARLFNKIPKEVGNLQNCPVDMFKRKLDKYLEQIPDEPLIPGYTIIRRCDSNSLIDMILFRQETTPVISLEGKRNSSM